jgi:mannose-6-phosphate isomerase-like protein (cupin superfamily)
MTLKKWVHHEREGEISEKPGRTVNWVQTVENTGAVYSSVCTCIYAPGARAKPAHSHPHGEETVYVIQGRGRAKIGENIYDIEPGSVVFFPQNTPHMIWNGDKEPMHIVCFYAPNEKAVEYEFFEDFDFPEFKG